MSKEAGVTIEQHHSDPLSAPALGTEGEPCPGCGSPLAADQRYCLECGRRRGDARLPFQDVWENRIRRQQDGTPPPGAVAPAAVLPPSRRPAAPAYVGAGVALFALVLGLGVLIGAAGDDSPRQVAAAPPQVITVAMPAAGQAVDEAFTGDWPKDKDGYTVQLRTLPKDGTQPAGVQAAKSEAQSKGAADVGALDSDEFASLDPGNYVIYAGVFSSRKQARKALRRVAGRFPGAAVVHVSASGGGLSAKGDKDALSGHKKEATVGKDQLKGLQKLSPDEYQKKAKKLPDKTKLPGKAPPKDDKKPGGGSKGDVIE
jgi:hypothetical protein